MSVPVLDPVLPDLDPPDAAPSTPSRHAVDLALAGVTCRVVCGEVELPGPTVLVALGDTAVHLDGDPAWALPPGRSTWVRDVHARGDLLLAVDPAATTRTDVEALFAAGWSDFYGADAPTRLLRSPQTSLGVHDLDLGALAAEPWGHRRPYEIRVNAWFAPAGTSCGIHRLHDFLELHTQIGGLGAMQRFDASDGEPVEQQLLGEGVTGPMPFCAAAESAWVYPWHQYAAITDAVWLAIEYHGVAEQTGGAA